MKTDILILGGGLAALAAADEAVKNSGSRVTLLQCGGGASPHIHGFCLPVGSGDSEALLLEDTLVSGCGYTDPKLARALCMGSLELMEYFRQLGLDIDREEGQPRLLKALGSSVPRIAGIENATGPAVMRKLRARLKTSGQYTELTHQRAIRLLTKDGRVIGARCFDLQTREFYNFYAGCVILATGGFCRIFPENTNAAEMGGDGIAMAYYAGAQLTDMEFIQFEPCAAVWPPQVAGKSIITTMFYNGAVLRNPAGERFMLRYGKDAECVPKDVLSRCIAHELLKNGATEHGGVYFDATGVPGALMEGVYLPYLQRYLNCGIDLRTTPVEIAPAAHTSCGGVVIDESCRTGIPGLIACGEVTGGLHGANRLGGNAGLETMMFGRIAGKTAAADVTVCTEGEEDRKQDIPADVSAMRGQLQQILRTSLNVVRTEKTMAAGLQQLKELESMLGEADNCYEKLRLQNDLLAATAALDGALERKTSVGCHFRADTAKEEHAYRVVIKNSGTSLALSRKSV